MLKPVNKNPLYVNRNPASAKVYSLPFVLLCGGTVFACVFSSVCYLLVFEYFQLVNVELAFELLVDSVIELIGFEITGLTLSDWFEQLTEQEQISLGASLFCSFIIAMFTSFKAALWAKNKSNLSAERKISGSDLVEFSEAEKQLNKVFKEEYEHSGKGYLIHPNIALPYNRENQNLTIIGQIGSGKTVIQLPIIQEVLRKQAKSLIFDIKGDFTSYFSHQEKIGLLAPWDERSLVWSISKDVVDEHSAHKFACALIPENKDPMW